jgi:ActR/RegA family two-component response regulator
MHDQIPSRHLINKPIIFLIDEDDDSRSSFRRSLKKKGYHVSLAIDEEDALDRVKKGCFNADLVLMNFVRKAPEQILEIGRNISRAGKLNAAIVVVAHKYGEDLEGKDIKISENEYITYLEDGEQLHHLIRDLTLNLCDEVLLAA